MDPKVSPTGLFLCPQFSQPIRKVGACANQARRLHAGESLLGWTSDTQQLATRMVSPQSKRDNYSQVQLGRSAQEKCIVHTLDWRGRRVSQRFPGSEGVPLAR